MKLEVQADRQFIVNDPLRQMAQIAAPGGAEQNMRSLGGQVETLQTTDCAIVVGIIRNHKLDLIVGAEGDETVPHALGYDVFRDAFREKENVTLLLREERDHKNLFYSDSAIAHRAALRRRWEEEGGKGSFEAYFAAAPDRLPAFEMDEGLMAEIRSLWE